MDPIRSGYDRNKMRPSLDHSIVLFDAEHADDGRSEDGVQENRQPSNLYTQENNSGTFVNGTVSSNVVTRVFVYDDFWDAQPHYGSLVDISMVRFILQPQNCTICQQPTSLPLPTHWSQRICTTCQTSLDADPSLHFLHDIVAKMYAFWLKLRREEHCDRIDWIVVHGLSTLLGINKGDPNHKTLLPIITDVIIHTAKGTQLVIRTLTPEQRNLLDEVLLATKQCHISLLIFTKLFQHLVSAPNSPIAKVQEVAFNPKGIPDVACNSHCVHMVTLDDSRRFAVSFTDRQLGWYPLVVPWEEYRAERMEWNLPNEEKELIFDLGYVYTENAYKLGNPQILTPNELKSNEVLQRMRGLNLGGEIMGKWEEWFEKEVGGRGEGAGDLA